MAEETSSLIQHRNGRATATVNRIINADCLATCRSLAALPQFPRAVLISSCRIRPYLVDYRDRSGRTVAGDKGGQWGNRAFCGKFTEC